MRNYMVCLMKTWAVVLLTRDSLCIRSKCSSSRCQQLWVMHLTRHRSFEVVQQKYTYRDDRDTRTFGSENFDVCPQLLRKGNILT